MTELNQPNTSPSVQPPVVEAGRPVAVATKAAPGTTPATASAPSTGPGFTPKKPKQPRKIFGIDMRAILTVLGLTLFFVLAMVGVLIALRQRQSTEETRAPSAPESRPSAAVTQVGVCGAAFTVAEPGIINCEEATFNDDFSNSTLNSRYVKGGAGNATISNGVLQLAIPDVSTLINTDASVFIETNDKVSGDFETQVDIASISVPANTPASFRFAVDNLDKRVAIAWEQNAASTTSIVTQEFSRSTGQTTNRQVASVSASLDQMKFKIERSGTTVATFYDIGNGFVEFGEFTDIPGAVLVQALVNNLGIPNTSTIAFGLDNFILQCPEEITYACNSACDTDAQCQGVDEDYVCDETSNTCRLESNPTSVTCEAANVTYSCNSSCETDAQCQTANSAYVCFGTGTQKNCRLGTNTSSTTCAAPTYSCNSLCTTNAQCQGVNPNFICATVNDEQRCRLQTNTTSESCQATVTESYTCNSLCTTNAQCQTANSNYVCATVGNEQRCRLQTNTASTTCAVASSPLPSPTPTVGCNDTCVNNADCSNANHICYNGSCRLAANPDNAACAPAVSPSPVAQASPQPELPEQLPETGAEDLARWLVPGIGALMLGALALFFL